MNKPEPSNGKPGATDAESNGEHSGAPAYENSGPGTPGNVSGAVDGKGADASPADQLKAEQATVSSVASGSTK